MKQKLITRLILGAFAGVAAAGAFAGQIQSSSVSVAREVITSDLQPLTAPTVSYRFAGDVNVTVQQQKFQVQLTLPGNATWGTAPSADTFQMFDPITSYLLVQGAAADYTVPNIGVSADGKTLWATFIVNTGPAAGGTGFQNVYNQPLITFNNSTLGTTDTTILGLKSVVGDLVNEFNASTVAPYSTPGVCQNVVTQAVSFKHYVALLNEAVQATDANATPDEHTRGGATNSATIMNFPTNVRVAVAASGGNAKVDVATANTRFTGSAGSYVSTTIANLGTVTLVQNGTGYDSNLINGYVLAGVAGGAYLTGLDGVATSAAAIGDVEVLKVDVEVHATNGFVPGGTLWLDTAATCTGGVGLVSGGGAATAITALNAAGPINLSITTPALVNTAFGATGTGPVHVCYGVAGVGVPIPLSSFTAKATVDKAPAGTPFTDEQDNVCNGNLYSLGGGVKIDVRNYANSQQTANTGWMSVIRLINNNETRTIDVYGQMIHADGTYGAWGKLADLPPRAVLNLTSAQVDALLVTPPASVLGAATNGPAVSQDLARGGSRLRITSNAGSTLRVQNYLYNPASQNFIEASSTQAVDFEGSVDRAPANEGQYQSQDAKLGIDGR